MKKFIFAGLAIIGLAIAAPNILAEPLTFTKQSGFEKLFPNDDPEGSMYYYEPKKVQILNRRKKTINFEVYFLSNKRDASSYSIQGYVISCLDGGFQKIGSTKYKNNEAVEISRKTESFEAADNSDFGKLRDRLCKKFGF